MKVFLFALLVAGAACSEELLASGSSARASTDTSLYSTSTSVETTSRLVSATAVDIPWEPFPFLKTCSRRNAKKTVNLEVGACKKECLQNPADAVFTAGLEDSFSATTDPAPSPSTDMVSSWSQCASGTFDQTGTNRFLCHTFTNLASDCPIVGARLRTCFRALNSPPPFGVNTDGMNLGFNGVPAWGTRLDNMFQNSAGDWVWEPLAEGCLDLDLSAFQANGGPLTNLIPQLNAAGSLDFLVQDDTAVDFVELTVTYSKCYKCLVESTSIATVSHPISGTQYIEVVNPDPHGCECFPIGRCNRLPKLVTYPNGQTVDVGQCEGRCPRWRHCRPQYRSELVGNIQVDVVERCRCTWWIIDVTPIKLAATEAGSVHNAILSAVGPKFWGAAAADYSTVYDNVVKHLDARYGMKTDSAAADTAKYLNKIRSLAAPSDDNPVAALTELLEIAPALGADDSQLAILRRIVSIFAIHQNDSTFDGLIADLLTLRDELLELIDDEIEALPNLVAASVGLSSAQYWSVTENQNLVGQKHQVAALPRWLRIVGADLIAGFVGGMVGNAVGGPIGGVILGVGAGASASIAHAQ
eukprot:TRINITY_DN10233_c0_g1_i1.p1 TRINITY_DN10233_c0_g1~~TRINITY_DN10233_c0_g1_i1.p1  ORF type:complete len:584 (-),score=141.85 TRINITY_DN10233_c0_g1_i1:41-1792(-)